jgi:hypothetical protein
MFNAANGGNSGVFTAFGDLQAVQDELHSQQLQDLMAGSALLRRPDDPMFNSFMCE